VANTLSGALALIACDVTIFVGVLDVRKFAARRPCAMLEQWLI
jgi:hypothetical protein